MRTSFYVLVGGFLFGVAFRSCCPLGQIEVASLFLLSIIIVGVGIFYGNVMGAAYVSLFLFCVVLGVIRTEFSYRMFEEGYVYQDGETISIVGSIVREPDLREEYALLHVRVNSEASTTVKTFMRVRVPRYPLVAYGTVLSCTGTVRVPRVFETETGRLFDYQTYLMKEGIHYELAYANCAALPGFDGTSFVRMLLAIKQTFLSSVSRLFPEPSASLLGGVIVGAKQSLGEEMLHTFRDTGIIHIVVLSGYNLTIIATAFMRVTTFFPYAFRITIGVIAVSAFAVLVGASATVMRAAVMAVLGMVVVMSHKSYNVFRALLFAGLCMVFWNPFILVFDSGFQLSFVATIGLIFISPFFTQRLTCIPEKWGVREIVSATLATQLAVLPLLLYHVGSISLVAPLVNVLILPVIPLIMLCGFIAGSVGVLSVGVALPIAQVTRILLEYIFSVVALCDVIPFASISIPPVHVGIVVFVYGMSAWLLYRLYRDVSLRKR